GGAPEKSRRKGARGFAPGGRTVARPGGGCRRSQRRRPGHGKLTSREPRGHRQLPNLTAPHHGSDARFGGARGRSSPPPGETANGEQRPASRLEDSWRLGGSEC